MTPKHIKTNELNPTNAPVSLRVIQGNLRSCLISPAMHMMKAIMKKAIKFGQRLAIAPAILPPLKTMRRTIIALAVCLAFATSASAQNSRQDGIVFTRNGFPAPGASVAVCSLTSITAASESTNTVTITTTLNPPQGSTVLISGVTPAAYNGSFTVLTTSGTNFTYTNPTAGLGAGTAFGQAVVTSTLGGVLPCQPLASLCSSNVDASCASSNPVTADGLGNYSFYIKPGRYLVQSFGSGLTARNQIDQVLPCDPSNCSLTSATIAGSLTAQSVNNFLYVGPGGYTTIPAALTAATSGQTIYVSCGTYAPFTISTANITLQGEGKCSIITGTLTQSLQESQANCTIPNFCEIVVLNANNVTFKGFQVQGQAPDGTTAQSCIEIQTGISGADVEDNYISGSTGVNGCNRGIYINPSATNFYVANNEMHQILGTASGSGYGIVSQAAGPGTIFSNKNYFPTSQGRHCLYIGQASNHVISESNYCFGGTNDCLELFATDVQSTDTNNELIGDHCDQTSDTNGLGLVGIYNNENNIKVIGVILTPSNTSTASGVFVSDNGSTNTHLPTNIDVEGVTEICGTASGSGLSINGTSGNMFRNNTFINCGNAGASQAININSHNPNHADNNMLIGNVATGSTAQRFAVGIQGTAPAPVGNIIIANTLGAGTNGVISEGGSGTIWQGNIISDTIAHISTVASSIWGQNTVNGIPTIGDPTATSTVKNVATPFSGNLRAATQLADQGTVCTNGELALSAGWQSTGTATVTGVAGNGQTCSWTITTGTTTAANPTVTDTLTNALPAATTRCWMFIEYGPASTHTAAAGEGFAQTTLSATAPVFTFNGTPTAAGKTYLVVRTCGP